MIEEERSSILRRGGRGKKALAPSEELLPREERVSTRLESMEDKPNEKGKRRDAGEAAKGEREESEGRRDSIMKGHAKRNERKLGNWDQSLLWYEGLRRGMHQALAARRQKRSNVLVSGSYTKNREGK